MLRLSRLSLGLAAAAAAAGLFAPTELRGLCADVAPAFAVAAFVLWRAASATRRRLADRHDAIPEAVPLGPDSFAQAAQSVADAVRAAPTLEQALLRTGEVLRGELGARSVRVFRVSHDGATPGMSELVAADPAFLAPSRAVLLDQSAIGRRCASCDPASTCRT